MLEREITAFFTALTGSSERGWPEISGQVLADALADSLLALGAKRGMGVGVLQTLIHEMQDRVNIKLNEKPNEHH